jgi:hypothetical protein
MDIESFEQRKLKFKAWNREARLLMRLDSIECSKGELVKKDHILLQFTGHLDQHEQEIYDMDILLGNSNKHLIRWDQDESGWIISPMGELGSRQNFTKGIAKEMIRLCSYFESR